MQNEPQKIMYYFTRFKEDASAALAHVSATGWNIEGEKHEDGLAS